MFGPCSYVIASLDLLLQAIKKLLTQEAGGLLTPFFESTTVEESGVNDANLPARLASLYLANRTNPASDYLSQAMNLLGDKTCYTISYSKFQTSAPSRPSEVGAAETGSSVAENFANAYEVFLGRMPNTLYCLGIQQNKVVQHQEQPEHQQDQEQR